MLRIHKKVFIKPFSAGAAHDGNSVVQVSEIDPSHQKVLLQVGNERRDVSLNQFLDCYVASVQGRSVGQFWEIAVEEALDILPGPGAREIRFLLGCDPTTMCPKVYGSYGKVAEGVLANGSRGGSIVPSDQIIRELSLGDADGASLLGQCARLALRCSETIAQQIALSIPEGEPFLKFRDAKQLVPRHLCVDIVIARRNNGLIEPYLLEVTYPPGPGSDRGVQMVCREGFDSFGKDFEVILNRDRVNIERINQGLRFQQSGSYGHPPRF